jgi:hypothetical protein
VAGINSHAQRMPIAMRRVKRLGELLGNILDNWGG